MVDQQQQNQNAVNMRRIRGLLVKPHSQLRFAFMLFGAGLLFLVVLVAYLLLSFNSTIESLHAYYQIDASVIDRLQTALFSTIVMTVIFGVVLAAITFSAGIALSHRIFGPVVPFQRHLNNLIEGNYSSRVSLRKRDEFQELMISMNQLGRDT